MVAWTIIISLFLSLPAAEAFPGNSAGPVKDDNRAMPAMKVFNYQTLDYFNELNFQEKVIRLTPQAKDNIIKDLAVREGIKAPDWASFETQYAVSRAVNGSQPEVDIFIAGKTYTYNGVTGSLENVKTAPNSVIINPSSK